MPLKDAIEKLVLDAAIVGTGLLIVITVWKLRKVIFGHWKRKVIKKGEWR